MHQTYVYLHTVPFSALLIQANNWWVPTNLSLSRTHAGVLYVSTPRLKLCENVNSCFQLLLWKHLLYIEISEQNFHVVVREVIEHTHSPSQNLSFVPFVLFLHEHVRSAQYHISGLWITNFTLTWCRYAQKVLPLILNSHPQLHRPVILKRCAARGG
jgi:hypothetical protein